MDQRNGKVDIIMNGSYIFLANRQRYAGLLFCLSLFLCVIGTVFVHAQELQQRTIRVAAFEGSYIHTGEDGKLSGYGYEFQQAVASYTGWSYQYIPSDWTDCYEKLENGEIDMFGGVSYTKERAENMLYSDQPMGEEKYYLYADLEKTSISVSDLTTLEGKRVGVLRESTPEEMLNAWEEKHGFHTQHVNVVSSEDILEKLANDEIDCFIAIEDPTWSKLEYSAFVSIGSSDIYFVISKNRQDVKDELDSAMRKIEHDRPFYKDDLYKQFLSSETYEIISDEEKDWISQHGPIRIGYYKNDAGVSMVNSDNGELVGAINDYVEHAKSCLSNQELEFELVGFDSQTEQYEALRENQIDMIFHVNQNSYEAEQNDMILSNVVYESSMAAITDVDYFDEYEETIVAVDQDATVLKWYISSNYPQWKIYECNSKEDAKKAVQDGNANCFIVKAGQSVKEVDDSKMHSIFLTKSASSCFAVNRKNTILMGILNKTLNNLQESQISGAVSVYDNASRKVTLTDFVKDNLLTVSVALGIICFLILMVILYLYRKTKMALVQAEKANAAKSNFLFNMSHDIRTPMNALLGYSELMKRDLTDPKLLGYQEKIEQSGNLLLSIINNVLDMARIESGKTALDESYAVADDILDKINSVFEEEAKKRGIQYIHEAQVEHQHIMCDITKVQEIFVNLVGNAIKYTPKGGTVTIRSQELPSTKEGFVTIKTEVIDTGIGMSKEFLPSLFVAFERERNTTTGKIAGTGLGMPIVKKYVDMMGGTIEVESELGKGSKFIVTLQHRIADPIYYKEKPVKSSETDTKNILQGKKILLAEDNELNAEIAMTILEDKGVIVDRVEDGIKCVAKMEQNPAGTYDLILMDIQMPNMDGYKATQAIRRLADEKKASIPIIAMTANAFEEDRKKAFENGMNGHIAKPVDIEKVEEVLVSILEK